MTTDKTFKRVVRARMAKTGERYAAARRSLIDCRHRCPAVRRRPSRRPPAGAYRLRGGLHPETATLANVLANQGVVSGLTGEPLTEATILGIGGGLGAGYILWEFKSHGAPILTLGFRNQWQYPWIPGWTGKTLERLGIEADVHETGGAKGAREALDARLDAGSPVIASVDLALIGTWGLPDALSGHFGHTFVIAGREADGTYLVDDRGTGAVPDRAGRHGRRARPDRVVQASDRSARRRPRARSLPIGFARRCRPASRTRSTTCARTPTRSRFPPGASGRG